MSRHNCKTSARAFTLVELLVVIGIIALLISILLPALTSARKSATALKCASNMRTIGQAMQLYASDYKGVIVPSGTLISTPTAYQQSWDVSLRPYLNKRKASDNDSTTAGVDYTENPVMQCPDDNVIRTYSTQQYTKRSYAMVAAMPRYAQTGTGYRDTSAGAYPPILGTGMGTSITAANPNYPGEYKGFHFIKFSDVKQSSETLLLAEFFDPGNVLGHFDWSATFGPRSACINYAYQQLGYVKYPAHAKKWNYLMVDGSVQTLAPQETLRGLAAQDGIWNGSGASSTYYLQTATGFSNYMWTVRADD